MAEQLALDFSVSSTQRHRRAVKANDEAAGQLDLFSSWVWSPNIDIHLDGAETAVASIAGKEPERAHDWLSGLVGGNLDIRKPRRVSFPVDYLDRFLHLRPPAQVTLDAASVAVARAIWADKLDLKPLKVIRDGRRLSATSARRWPRGFAVTDVPWNAIVSVVHLKLPLEVDDSAKNLFARRLGATGAKVGSSGLAGSAVTIETSRPEMLERLKLPGLAFDGDPQGGRYRLPLLSAEPLLRQELITVPKGVEDAIRKATRPIRPLSGLPESFPWTLYDFQAADAGRGLRILETTGGVLLAGDMGSGKLQPLDSPVLTPTGWTRIGDLQVGSPVMGSDGQPHRVTGVFPQGEQEIFKVTFTDGTTTLCGDDHLWAAQSAVMKRKGRGYKVLPLKDIRAKLRDGAGNLRWYIPIAAPQQFPGLGPLPVDPYVVGAFLGDGGLSTGSVNLTTADPDLAAEVAARLPAECELVQTSDARGYGYRVRAAPGAGRRNVMAEKLGDLGMIGFRAWEKSIPERYKWASLEDRIALLQGLLDTDGGGVSAGRASSIEYSSTSEQLANDVVFLVQSLGGTARISSRIPTYTHDGVKKQGRRSWRLCIALPNEIPAFRLARKAEAYRPRAKYFATRGIKEVESVGTSEAVCISVSAPDQLYLTDGLVCTHNTTVSLAITQHQELWPLLVVAPLSAFSTWARQLGQMNRNYYLATGSPAKSWEEIETGGYEAVVMSFDRVGAFVELIERMHFKAVIADEVQRIRTPGSKRSRAMRQIAGAIPYRMGLSGTPLTNTVNDVLPLGAFLVPGEWKPRAKEKDLEDLYPGDPTESLAEHLGSIMVRRRIDQVGKPMPKRNDHRIYVRLTPEQRRALEALEAEAQAAKEAGEFADNSGRMHAFAKLQKMRQIINSPAAAGVPGPNPKVAATIDMAKEFLAKGRKGVIFCADRTTFKEIGRELDAENIGWVGIWGSTPPAERIENERKFHAGDPAPNGHETSVVVCTIQAGAESWSASPTGTWLITTAYVYAPSTLAQMSARVHRMNSDLHGPEIEVMFMHATGDGNAEKGSLDDRMVEILAVKEALFAQVVDRREHVDGTKVHYSMEDLRFLLTGERDQTKVAAEKDSIAAAKRAQDRKDHAKASLYKRKRDNASFKKDDGSVTHTLEEYRAAHPELADEDDLDVLIDAADHLDDLDDA